MKDYIVEDNAYEMEPNEITIQLRSLYMPNTGQIIDDLGDGKIFEELFEFCIGALEVYYAVFKKSDRFELLKDEVDR